MNDIQPFEPETLYNPNEFYQWPTSLQQSRNALTPYQKAQRETDFANAPQFQNRRIVTVAVVALCIATLVTHIVTHGINRRAAFATVAALVVAYCVRNYTCPKHSGTKQNYKS